MSRATELTQQQWRRSMGLAPSLIKRTWWSILIWLRLKLSSSTRSLSTTSSTAPWSGKVMTRSYRWKSSLRKASISRSRTHALLYKMSQMWSYRMASTFSRSILPMRPHWTASSLCMITQAIWTIATFKRSCSIQRRSRHRRWCSMQRSYSPSCSTSSARLSHLRDQATPSRPFYMWSSSSKARNLRKISKWWMTSLRRGCRTIKHLQYTRSYYIRCSCLQVDWKRVLRRARLSTRWDNTSHCSRSCQRFAPSYASHSSWKRGKWKPETDLLSAIIRELSLASLQLARV